jgi:long-subunit fatty acid transport protein
MKNVMSASTVLLMIASVATAGGLDRSGQSVGVIFEEGNILEFSIVSASPDVSGSASGLMLGTFGSGNMANSFVRLNGAVKRDLNDSFSYAIIYDQPFGADVEYATGTGYFAQGSAADADSWSMTMLGNYKLGNGFSVHGGLRYQVIGAEISKPPAGYSFNAEDSSGLGYVVGAAYERPDIALRVALTYNSAIDHTLDVTETCAEVCTSGTSETDVKSPESLNLEFQTGIAPDTLLFGSIRHARWTQFDLNPAQHAILTGGSLQDYDNDTTAYSIGVGRRLNDQWAIAATFGYEAETGDLAGNLAPTDGSRSIGLGATYTGDGYKVSFGGSYVKLGDATVEHPVIAGGVGADFADNSVIGFGLKFTQEF